MNLPILLAFGRDLPRVWGRFDHQRPADGITQLLVIVGLAVLAVLVVIVWLRATRRPRRQFVSNSQARLFRELCQAHDLGYSHRRLLKRLAAARGVAVPAMLFVDPKHFDTANLPASLDASANEVRRLRALIFGAGS
jgi:hypothetical protein